MSVNRNEMKFKMNSIIIKNNNIQFKVYYNNTNSNLVNQKMT